MVTPTTDKKSSKTVLQRRLKSKREIIPRDVLDLSPDSIIVFSRVGTIAEVNQGACRLLGVRDDQLLNVSVYDLCAADERDRLKNLVEASLNGQSTVSGRTKFHSMTGRMVDVDLSVSRYPQNSKARRQYCVLIGRDISEEKKKELDLLRFSNIAHYTVNPLEITDVNGRIIYVNPAFERTSGYSREELIGRNPNIFGSHKHPKAFWERMWKTITSGNVWTGEIENRRKDGEPFFTQLLISPIIDAEGKTIGYFGVHRDITGQKHLEQQLIHAQKMESIGLLAAGIAHEVGNPLTSISSLVQVIQRTTEDDFTQEKLELIKSQITRISRIIRDLVDFSRRSSYEVQLTDINKNIREAVEIVRVGRKAKAISFSVELDESIPMLPLVPDQMEQVFINILINAVDAIHSDSDSRSREGTRSKNRAEISTKSTVADEHVVITIADNGRGISEDHLPKIFEPFFTTKKVGEGTGLGLWVSYGLIKSFQGNIMVESIEGEGTTFTITLPLHSEFN